MNGKLKREQARRSTKSRDRRIMLLTIPLGAVLLIVGQLGARSGMIWLPFDPHHVVTQLVGGALLLFGLTRWR